MQPQPPKQAEGPLSSNQSAVSTPTLQSPPLQIYNSLVLAIHPSLPVLLKTLFAHTPTRGLLRLSISIILSHILRTFLPSILFFWPHALSDMKLAKSSPHYYLLSSTSFSWSGLVLWSLYKMGLRRMRSMAWEGMRRDEMGDGWCVLYLTLGIVGLEAAWVQSCWSGAQLFSYATLFLGSKDQHKFLETFLEEKSWRIMAQLGLVVEWLVHGVCPALRDVFGGGRWLAGLAYTAIGGTTAYLVRYSNKHFVLLEMSDVWVMGGWLGLAGSVVGMEMLRRRELRVKQQ